MIQLLSGHWGMGMSTIDVTSRKLVDPRVALVLFLVLAIALTSFILPETVANPFFSGDSAHRMNMANYPAIRLDNRVWLPTLQVHIWILYLLEAPYWVFKLVPCLYYLAAIVLLGMLSFNATGRTREGLLFSTLLVFLFARQNMIMDLGSSLMQEIIGVALLYLLVLGGGLELKKKGWLVLAAIPALMTRDDFWIYLFVVSLLNWKTILSDRKYTVSFSLLWAVPVVWLLLIPIAYLFVDGRFPDIPAEWPLGINKTSNQAITDQMASAASLWLSLTRTGVAYFAALLLALGAAAAFLRSRGFRVPIPGEGPLAAFVPVSLLSLTIIYALVLVFDPYQATPGGSRMSLPLLVHGFVWAIIFYQAAPARLHFRIPVAVLVVVGLAPSVNFTDWSWQSRDYSQVRGAYERIASDLDRFVPNRDALICIIDPNYFSGLRNTLPATLYRKRSMVLQTRPFPIDRCAAVLMLDGLEYEPAGGFKAQSRYILDDRTYTLLLPGK